MVRPPLVRGFVILCGVGAVLVLIVVAASATIRLSGTEAATAIAIARGVHRAAASLAAIVVLAVAFIAPPGAKAAAIVTLVLTLALSIVGWVTGTHPPLAAALFNQAGGIALAALLAWLGGRAEPVRRPGERALARAVLGLAALQALGGVLIVAVWKDAPLAVYLAHAACGLAAAACLAALAAAQRNAVLLALACAAPALGIAVSLMTPSVAAQAAHAFAAAALLAGAARMHACTAGTA